MKIDIYTHVMPERYKKALYKHSDKFATEKAVQDRRPALTDHEMRLRILEEFPDVVEVLSATMPPVEEIVGPSEAVEMAKVCNDEMADLVARNPKKYIAAIANLPLNDMGATLKETERAIKVLGFKGVQVHTRVLGKPLTTPEMMPLYEMMSGFDLPIWIHPMRSSSQPDYASETVSHNQIFSIFGWPFDTTVAMIRLVFAGIFEKFPNIKFITHHCGALVPYFRERIIVHYNNGLERLGADHYPGLTKHPIEYLRMFYNDTALNGNPSALNLALEFFGEDRILFGTDLPYDVENGRLSVRQTIDAIEKMGVSESTRQKIFEGNARRLLHL
jgi:predicted TIM-barrel fold metal-dependent hydrolase